MMFSSGGLKLLGILMRGYTTVLRTTDCECPTFDCEWVWWHPHIHPFKYKLDWDQSDLHVIIFDEIDAIGKSRGSTRDGTGVHDSIVNQLLTKIDGVGALNNVLLIGMTNKNNLLDEALLRPGRLEVQVEISLPDENGRLQILQIHTNKMKQNSFLAPDVDLQELGLVYNVMRMQEHGIYAAL
ncbi:unnamed protein product [Lactuca virosa]|uniref:Vesicle-fusing ATPase n=1 Tax=Lactuca virosa TaxID=75947 RepID=A0AAU9LZG0_9ASTR|nr:unnamed protein product [Lactuca virosa]